MVLENNHEKVRAIDMLFLHTYVWRMRLKFSLEMQLIPTYLFTDQSHLKLPG